MSGLFEFTSKDDGKFIDGSKEYYEKAEQAALKSEASARSSQNSADLAAGSSKTAVEAYNKALNEASLALGRANDAKASADTAVNAKNEINLDLAEIRIIDTEVKNAKDVVVAANTEATTAATNAKASEDNSKNSENAAWKYQDEANTYQQSASASADKAYSEAGLALDRSNKAKDWAVKTDGPVEGTEYSAKYWAQTAGSSVAGVSSFKGRSGVVTPVTGDYDVSMVTGAAPLADAVFTSVPKAPTAPTSANDTCLANTQWVQTKLSGKANLDALANKANIYSPNFSGTPTAPYISAGRNANDTSITNAQWVKGLAATDAEMISGASNSFFVTPRSFNTYAQVTAQSFNGTMNMDNLGAGFVYTMNGWSNGPDENDYNNTYAYPYGMVKTSLNSTGMFKYQELTTSSTTDRYSQTASERPHRAIRAKIGKSSYTPWSVLYGSADVKYTPWVNISGLNGWTNNDGQGSRSVYRKVFGRVYVEMNMTGGSPYQTLFILPPGYRPLNNVMFPSVSASFEAVGLYVDSSGSVKFVTGKEVSNVAAVFSFDVNTN